MLNNFYLQLFAEAGAAATAATGTEAGEVSDAGIQHKKANPFANVKFGRQEEPTEEQEKPEEAPATEESEKKHVSIAELVKTDPEAQKELNEMFSKRLKGQKANNDRLAKWAEIAPILAQNYDLSEDDIDRIVESVKSDKSLFKKKAVANGTTADEEADRFRQLQENRKRENELKAYKEQEAERRHRAEVFARWDKEIPELQKRFPDFDLRREMQNEAFARKAEAEGVIEAYESVHREEIQAAIREEERQKAISQVTDAVAANRVRPAEAGLAKAAVPVVKTDPRNLTKEERAEIRKRVRLGEKIIW